MVTNINIPLDDCDYKKLIAAKGEMTWRDVLFEWCSSKMATQDTGKREFR